MSAFSERPRYPRGHGDSEDERVIEKRLTQVEAARILGLTTRQVRRLRRLRRTNERDGARALASKQRGRPSNRRLED